MKGELGVCNTNGETASDTSSPKEGGKEETSNKPRDWRLMRFSAQRSLKKLKRRSNASRAGEEEKKPKTNWCPRRVSFNVKQTCKSGLRPEKRPTKYSAKIGLEKNRRFASRFACVKPGKNATLRTQANQMSTNAQSGGERNEKESEKTREK